MNKIATLILLLICFSGSAQENLEKALGFFQNDQLDSANYYIKIVKEQDEVDEDMYLYYQATIHKSIMKECEDFECRYKYMEMMCTDLTNLLTNFPESFFLVQGSQLMNYLASRYYNEAVIGLSGETDLKLCRDMYNTFRDTKLLLDPNFDLSTQDDQFEKVYETYENQRLSGGE